MNIIFAGTPEFSAVILQALLHSKHSIKAVYTQPDRPAGRGRKLTASPVKQLALEHALPVYQPVTLRDTEEQQKLSNLKADVMIVVAYGLLLPQPVLSAPKFGCINVHASLLPRWRGAAPIQRAILAGDKQTGITIMQMDAGLDTGPMLSKSVCSINDSDTSAILYDRLSHIGAEALLAVLHNLTSIKAEEQDASAATYAHKIKKEEAELDWNLSAYELANKVRGFNPWPVAYFGQVRVWEAIALGPMSKSATPGAIIHASPEGIDVATGNGILRLLKLQFPGGKVLSVREVLNAHHQEFTPGKLLS